MMKDNFNKEAMKAEALGRALLRAIGCRGALTQRAESLLDQGASSSVENGSGSPALVLAAYWGHFEIMQLLIERGADLESRNRYSGDTALITATRAGYHDIACLLLDKKADLDAINRHGDTALIAAVARGHVATAKALIDAGCDLNKKNRNGSTALMLAAEHGHLDLVRMLLTAGADQNKRDKQGITALMWAVKNGIYDLVDILADSRVLNIKSKRGQTALMWAARAGNIHLVELLTAKGADISIRDYRGKTALDFARMNEDGKEAIAFLHKTEMEKIIRDNTILQKDIRPVRPFKIKKPNR